MTENGSRRMLTGRVCGGLGARAWKHLSSGFVAPSPSSEDFWTVLFEELRRAGFVEGGNLQVVGEFGITPNRADAVAAAAVLPGADDRRPGMHTSRAARDEDYSDQYLLGRSSSGTPRCVAGAPWRQHYRGQHLSVRN
jgi:hypothetical protein